MIIIIIIIKRVTREGDRKGGRELNSHRNREEESESNCSDFRAKLTAALYLLSQKSKF